MKTISFRVVIITLLLMLLVQIPIRVSAQVEIMSITEVEAGMKGVGKTVISGTTIEEFDVEILGVLTNQSSVGDLILVKVSGPLIDKTGGIAAGMSGSPVYIDGKLIGAIGYGWGLTDHRLGMITPIETMLQVLQLDHAQGKADQQLKLKSTPQAKLPSTVQLGDRTVSQIVFCDSYHQAIQFQSSHDTLVAYPAQTPLLVNGLSGRALDRLMDDLKEFNLIPVQTGGGLASANLPTSLEPGGSIAVQLVRGDIDISAIGTLTYQNGNDILGFGHPFLGVGPVEFYLSGAEILTVIDHLEMPFKLGVPTEPLGTITQDRNAAVGGQIGILPKIIPVNITVYDLDLGLEKDIQFQVIRDEELVVPLVTNAVLQSIDSVMDRQGYGTSTMEFQIMGDKLPDHIFKYSNMYYSSSDIAARTLYDLYNVMNTIVTNPFEKVNLVSIHGQIQIVRKRQIAIVEEVKLLNTELYPGDTAQVEVTLRPHRAEPFSQILEIPIPENIQTGEASLTVSGGYFGAYQSVDLSLDTAGEATPQDHVIGGHYKNIKDVLKDYQKSPKNNELVVEILPYYIDVMEPDPIVMEGEGNQATVEEGEDVQQSEEGDLTSPETAETAETVNAEDALTSEDSSEEDDSAKKQSAKESFPTDYVLEGSLTLEIVILEVESLEILEEDSEATYDFPELELTPPEQTRPQKRGKNI